MFSKKLCYSIVTLVDSTIKPLQILFKSSFGKFATSLLLLLTISLASYADGPVDKFRSVEFAYTLCDADKNWQGWSEWEPSNLLIIVDQGAHTIAIYSDPTQNYQIHDTKNSVDNEQNNVCTFTCVDGDGARCHIRFVMNDVGSQLYVDYSNAIYVYNVVGAE